jgi:4-aminobutyrate aminotransferase-like enzyme
MVKVQQRVDCDQIIKEIEEIEAGGLHGQLPLVWKSAKNWTVRDQLGQYYLDFTSSIFVANCGHSAVIKEIKLQLRRQLIHSYTFPTVTKLEFLKRLKAFLPGFCEKIFLASAGSEVTSWALTLMRAKTGKPIVIHFDGAFHGKTGHAVELQDEELSLPFPGEDTDWNAELEATLEKYKDRIGGIMFESYQGWSAKFTHSAMHNR